MKLYQVAIISRYGKAYLPAYYVQSLTEAKRWVKNKCKENDWLWRVYQVATTTDRLTANDWAAVLNGDLLYNPNEEVPPTVLSDFIERNEIVAHGKGNKELKGQAPLLDWEKARADAS